MCTSCLSSVEALSLCGAGAWSMVGRLRDNLAARRLGIDALARRARTWDDTARFLATMGHDAVAVLGPRPAPAIAMPTPGPTPQPRPTAPRELVGAGLDG